MRRFLPILLSVLCLCVHAEEFSQCSKQTLQSFFFDQGVPFDAVTATDAKYALPTVDWLEDFCIQLRREQQKQGVSVYVKAANNCTKFSRFAATFAAKVWLKHPDRLKDRALAFGQVMFFSGEEVGHSINCAIIRGKAGLELVFIEPQGCAFTSLTKDQIRSAIFLF